MGHFWPYSTWGAHVHGVLASKLDVYINLTFIIMNIFFLYLQAWVRVSGPVSGPLRERESSLFFCGYTYSLQDQDTTWPAAYEFVHRGMRSNLFTWVSSMVFIKECSQVWCETVRSPCSFVFARISVWWHVTK